MGILLDQPQIGLGNGTLGASYYFYSDVGFGYFTRPNKIELGDFPKI